MIKRILLKTENDTITTKISAFVSTNTIEESILIGFKAIKNELTGIEDTIIIRNMYLDVSGSESDVSEIQSFKNTYINALNKRIDEKTDKILLNGFKWNNISFSLDSVHLADYRDVVSNLKQGILSYPYTIKGQNNKSIQLTNDNIDSFFTAGLEFKETALQTGWLLKDSLINKTELELLNFIDNRE